jgi:hypothetical protein
MDIEQINDVVIEYLGKMLIENEAYDIYDLSEDDFDNIKNEYLNDWENKYDIITEYFGNQLIFTPSLDAFMSMMEHIDANISELEGIDDVWKLVNNHTRFNQHTYANTLRHYAYWYIDSVGYRKFLDLFKKWVQYNN